MNATRKKWLVGMGAALAICLLLRPIIADNEVQINKELGSADYEMTETARSGASSGALPKEGTEKKEMGTADSKDSSKAMPIHSKAKQQGILVYVTGAVESPGLYELPGVPHVGDAIKACGGLLPYAAADTLNLAEQIPDGTHIHVPFSFTGNPEVLLRKQKININTADDKELQTLNGVGPAIAKRIIEYRTEHGKFGSIEDIKKVKGIGNGLFNKCKAKITV